MKNFLDKETGEITVPNPKAVRTQYNSHQFPAYYEVNSMPSLTLPDQTLTISQLLERHQRGLPISGNAGQPIFHGDEEMPDLRRLDLSEIHELKLATQADIRHYQEELALDEKAKFKAKQEEIFNDEVEKRIKAKKPKDEPSSK